MIRNHSLFVALLSVILPSLVLAQSFELPTGATSPETALVTVESTTDPANHGCCVTLPPSEMEIFLLEGRLSIDSLDTSTVPWLPFDSMVVDSNNEFTGQNTATVAGFTNIVSVITGRVSGSRISAEVTIGANGGLPTGAPITFSLGLEPSNALAFFNTTATPNLAVNFGVGVGSTIDQVEAASGIPSSFTITLDSNGIQEAADWWLVIVNGEEISSFDLNTGQFELGLRPTYQGPAIDIEIPIEIPISTEVTLDPVTIGFGLDLNADGMVTATSLYLRGISYF